MAEQSRIGEFFRVLDDLIAAAKKKADLLKLKKRYYLQAIFNQQIRFKGFTEPWQQRKAKDCFIPVSERNHPELPVLSSTQEAGMVYRRDLDIDIKYDQSTLSSYKVVRPGNYVISLRSFQGGFEYSDKLGIVSPAYTIFRYVHPANNDDFFWKTFFKSYTFVESLKKVTFGIRDGKSISFNEFGTLKLRYPSLSEQVRIGEFFRTLDDLIVAATYKVEVLMQRKNAYLQRLFV